uniref:Integrase catalytic domain-containing protein n=1 Tax=Setaria digitata TaxID=48799 RepID=A0A915PEQ7_9BILA
MNIVIEDSCPEFVEREPHPYGNGLSECVTKGLTDYSQHQSSRMRRHLRRDFC